MPKRRGHGEGSIYPVKDKAGKVIGYRATVDLGFVGGRRRRKYLSGKTRKEVADKLKALHRDQASGLPIITERQTVADYLAHWLDAVVAQRNRPRTEDSYRDMVRLHIGPEVGHYQLSKLNGELVQLMLNNISAKGLSPRTVQYARVILRHALSQAVKWRLVTHNAADHTEAPRSEDTEVQPLSLAQAQILLEAIKGSRYELVYLTMLLLGLRRGEALALLRVDLNLAAKTIRVTGTLQRVRGKLVRSSPKTKQSRRTLALPETLFVVLKAHLEIQIERWPDSEYLFVTSTGTPIEPMNLVHEFKRILRKSGLPVETRLHDLRHSCVAFLIAQGVHPKVIQAILGHTQISTTLDIYGHLLEGIQAEAMEKIDDLLHPPKQDEEEPPEEPPEDKS